MHRPGNSPQTSGSIDDSDYGASRPEALYSAVYFLQVFLLCLQCRCTLISIINVKKTALLFNSTPPQIFRATQQNATPDYAVIVWRSYC